MLEAACHLVAEDHVPVRDVQQAHGRGLALQFERQVGDRRVHEVDREHRDERGEQAQRAPRVEVAHRDAVGTPLLVQQQRRDEEAAQHEEHVDAEGRARHDGEERGRVEPEDDVRRQHEQDRDSAHAVEGGNVAEHPLIGG